jgi:hypothetical protein
VTYIPFNRRFILGKEFDYISFDHKGERYMLYNGNGYGQTGFGLAVLAQSEATGDLHSV